MSHTPIGEPHDPYEKYRVEGIEKERLAKEKEKAHLEPEEKKRFSFLASVLLFFRKVFERLQESKELSLEEEKELTKTVLTFKEFLEGLKREDRSQDTLFLNQLSETWHHLLEELLHFRRASPLANQYTALIKAIETYPEKAEHTLGYYLTEHAGEKWLPFPFMELLKHLHLDHQHSPEESTLSQWTSMIDALLTALKSRHS